MFKHRVVAMLAMQARSAAQVTIRIPALLVLIIYHFFYNWQVGLACKATHDNICQSKRIHGCFCKNRRAMCQLQNDFGPVYSLLTNCGIKDARFISCGTKLHI
jgi:hypothetical protein